MMNKLPTKQIYLLSIIVLGIITLSVYSTYAIFTFEASTSDVFSINTPNNLSLSESTSKYKQVTVPKDSYITTDIDIYNNFDYDICYSIWYKTSNKNIKIYENTSESLTTSGTLLPVTGKRVNILLINDSENDANVKIGLSFAKNSDACSLNITSDKQQILSTINSSNTLEKVISETKEKNEESSYITYKDLIDELNINLEDSIMISKTFNYKDELFTLTNPIAINKDNIDEYLIQNESDKYYTCLNKDNCQYLYQINEIKKENNIYTMTKYNKLVGYMKGISGLRKVANNYYFYGDNPNNYLYYNCTNELDNKTCELWRIIGLIYDNNDNKYLTKIIKDDYISRQIYDNKLETWNESNINNYFKEYKLENDSYLKEITFKQENLISLDTNPNEILLFGEDIKSKINIMNLSDYLNASICTNKKINEFTNECLTNNWLNKDNKEWTMTMNYIEPKQDEATNEPITVENNQVYTVGSQIESTNVSTELFVRPTVYLKNRLLVVSGDGTFDNPYVIR